MHTYVAGRLVGDGIIELGTGLAQDVGKLILAALAAIVLWFIAKTVLASGGAVGATVIAILMGGLILWAANNLDTVQGWFGDELDPGAISRTVDPGPSAARPHVGAPLT